jgi:N-acetyl-anhydromuramyl-L-alanine amidase AmpD
MAAGRLFHTGTRVVLWTDPSGYDAYRVERRFAPLDNADWQHTQAGTEIKSPARYNMRTSGLTKTEITRVRGGGWDLPTLRKVVDQFVIHFDVCGLSRECFDVLHDRRGLSVHFMLDIDGTIYQTLDLKERAWHATTANSRSVGIEIANMGAYAPNDLTELQKWYTNQNGKVAITIPPKIRETGILTPGFAGHPARNELIRGNIQGDDLVQYDFTPQQYEALAHLVAALTSVFPQIRLDYPRDAKGAVIPHKLDDAALENYHGILGHYHVQDNKNDPGPAFQWDKVMNRARELLHDGLSPAALRAASASLPNQSR